MRAISAPRQLTTPFSSTENAGDADMTKADTRRSISSGRPFRAADKIIVRSSLSKPLLLTFGINVKPLRVPTSSPSTNTVPSSRTAAIKFADSFILLLRCAARLSTKRWVRRSCNSSDNLSSIDFASACQSCFASSHPDLCVIYVQVRICEIRAINVSMSPSSLSRWLI